MARTIAQIQQDIITAKNADTTLSTLSSTSNVAIWRLWAYVVAFCQWALEVLFDKHKDEVNAIISNQKPHTLKWYVTMAKLFQLGVTLPPDTDIYPTTTPSALIIKYAAAEELSTGFVRIKVATISAGVLGAVSAGSISSFTAYMNRIKDAGVRLQITTSAADNLHLKTNIYYDPLVLDANGARLDGVSTTPVEDAINAFLANLPFNGLFVLNRLVEAVEKVEGVIICNIILAEANHAYLPYIPITYEYSPDAGYMALDHTYFTTAGYTNYIAHMPI
jgi:hypothetical protein